MASLALRPASTGSLLRARFIACVFTGSFLLFLVQPMVARMALPRLGGAPAVWNSAMLVYQALLLAGYAYAHFLGRLAPRRQAIVHFALFAAAALSLPIALIAGAPSPGANIFLWVPWLLIVSIGPLFLVVSAQAPLMQRWFALAGGGDPYPLYAASNFGSFLGLITYPLMVEPLLPVAAQSLTWSVGYGLLALLLLGCALTLPREAPVEARAATAGPTRPMVVRWILLAAIPSGLMLSTTLHLTTDIVAMPLLWVVPLGLYLLSFSAAFAVKRSTANLATRIAPFALLITACTVSSDALPFALGVAAVTLLCFFVIATAIHARLFDSRPDAAHLTGFYLATSVGGVLGGLFCALVAPLTFDWSYEHPILLFAAACALVGTNPFPMFGKVWDGSERSKRIARWVAIVTLIATIAASPTFSNATHGQLFFVGALTIIVLAIFTIGHRLLFALAMAALMLSLGGWLRIGLSMDGRMTRSFFGIYSVRELDDNARLLVHGTTSHGIENLGTPERERMPTSYYVHKSGVGLALDAAPAIFPNARVGIVGLGAGTLSCYAQPGQAWKFYEIDPKVVSLAKTRFRFLANCQTHPDIVLGDARLMLQAEAPASADVLVVDAFSSDAVPMHLLTLEAFSLYRRHLSANGILMVHISNRFLDLKPVVSAAAAHGWTARTRYYAPPEADRKWHSGSSLWVMLSPSPATIAAVEKTTAPGTWTPLAPTASAPWTDDHSSILPIILWHR